METALAGLECAARSCKYPIHLQKKPLRNAKNLSQVEIIIYREICTNFHAQRANVT